MLSIPLNNSYHVLVSVLKKKDSGQFTTAISDSDARSKIKVTGAAKYNTNHMLVYYNALLTYGAAKPVQLSTNVIYVGIPFQIIN